MELSKDEYRARALEPFELGDGPFPSEAVRATSLVISAKRIADALVGIEEILEKIYKNMPEPRS